jgi:putative transposase
MTAPRVYVEGLSVHIIQRGNNRCSIVRDDIDREEFLLMLGAAVQDHPLDLHGYVLMDTHFHLLATPRTDSAFARAMRQLDGRYVRRFNDRYDRIGTLWSHRPRGFLIEDERRWLACLRYIEQNPVRAKMVERPGDYRWSSYAVHAHGARCDWLTPHPVYRALGDAAAVRQAEYRRLCGDLLNTAELADQRYPRRPCRRAALLAARS